MFEIRHTILGFRIIEYNIILILGYLYLILKLGLFQKAIMQSGCMLNSWAFTEKHKEAAFKLAKNLGCVKEDPKEVVQFLLSVPAIDIVKLTKIEVVILKIAENVFLKTITILN